MKTNREMGKRREKTMQIKEMKTIIEPLPHSKWPTIDGLQQPASMFRIDVITVKDDKETSYYFADMFLDDPGLTPEVFKNSLISAAHAMGKLNNNEN